MTLPDSALHFSTNHEHTLGDSKVGIGAQRPFASVSGPSMRRALLEQGPSSSAAVFDDSISKCLRQYLNQLAALWRCPTAYQLCDQLVCTGELLKFRGRGK